MSKFTLLDLAKRILEREGRPMTTEEIWEAATRDEKRNFKGKTPWRSIGARVYVDMRDNPDSPFVKIDSKPRKFYLRDKVTDSELEKIVVAEKGKVQPPKKPGYKERDLHPFLSFFAYTYLLAYTKTIRHEKSQRRTRYAQWLHPDMVGVYFPIDQWEEEVLDLAKEIGSPSIKLFSFEIKRELSFSTLRESFFQAVSNSSWANEGYLVVAELDQDSEFLSELKRLSTAFGIGVIRLDLEDPDASELLLPAGESPELDWETIDKLAYENDDFSDFLRRIRTDFSSNEARKEKYDKVYEPEELVKRFKRQMKARSLK